MTTYLVTGVNRGIGFGFLKVIASNPDNLLIGTVRSPKIAKEIEMLGYKNIKLLILDAKMSDEEFKLAFKDLEALTPNGIDVIIHNIGIVVSPEYGFTTVEKIPQVEYDNVFDVNVSGAAKFYRTIYPKLETNGKPVKLVFMSSTAGCITDMVAATGPYGMSKAALNNMVKQISVQRKDKGDIVIPIHPGVVDTDGLAPFKEVEIVKKSMISPEESVRTMLSTIEKLTLEDTGKFFNYDGTSLLY